MKEFVPGSPEDGDFEVSIEAHMVAESHAKRVQDAVQMAEVADPGVRFRVAQEALLRRRRNPR
jgi:hypothetical protein